MSIDILKRLGIFVVLVLVQGLVFNHIHLFNCATPLLYIIMVLHFRRNHPRWSVMLWSFMLGLCIDVFANTPGVAAASMTAIGLLQNSTHQRTKITTSSTSSPSMNQRFSCNRFQNLPIPVL